jgi:hypothetical protein
MNTLKKLYRDFFGLTEQSAPATSKSDPTKDVVLSPKDAADPKKVLAAQNILKTTKGRIHIEEDMIDEAELVNKITDYQGGVEMLFTDPATAKQTMIDIITWAKKKGFEIINKEIYTTKSGTKAGYIYFRIGTDVYKDSQRIQGYISQSPGISKFRFKVKQ